jgi:hypothetical protein
MSVFRSYFFLLLFVILAGRVSGQATSSPFSTFGIGEHFGNALVNNQGMGGTGVAQPQFWYANNQNPALLIYNNLTIFQAGIVAEQRTIKTDTLSEKTKAGNLNYLVTAFPIKPGKWSTSLALSPYTRVKYRLNYADQVTNRTEVLDVIEEGEGGISQFSWSNGVRLTKEMSVGLRASYLFGSIVNTYQNRILGTTQTSSYYSTIEEKTYVKDFTFSAGFSFSKDSLFSRSRYRLSFGAVYDFATDLSARQRTTLYRDNLVTDPVDADTLSSIKGVVRIPPGITTGIALSRGGKWAIAAEFAYYDWSAFRSVSRDDEGLQKSWRAALGWEITPDAFALDQYLERITYRLGVSMEEYPFLAQGNEVRDVGANFGFSLPAGRSSLDLGFRYGVRGNQNENFIEENYFRVYFGVTFNDQWFIKRKFD